METSDLKKIKTHRDLQSIQKVLSESDWPMTLLQIANNARLSNKTVEAALTDNLNLFVCEGGKYMLRSAVKQSEPQTKPPTQSVSVSGFEFGAVGAMVHGVENKPDNTPLTHIMGIPLNPTQPEAQDADKETLARLLDVLKSNPKGFLSRDLMMALNLRRDEVYKFCDILISQKLAHSESRKGNRNIVYKYGPRAANAEKITDLESMVTTTNTQKRSITLNQEQVINVLKQVFSMDSSHVTQTSEGLVIELTSEVIF